MDLTSDISWTVSSDLQNMKNKNTDARGQRFGLCSLVTYFVFMSLMVIYRSFLVWNIVFQSSPSQWIAVPVLYGSSRPNTLESFSVSLSYTPWTVCQQLLLVLPSKYIQNPILSHHTHLSHSGPGTVLSFLNYYSSSPNWSPCTL